MRSLRPIPPARALIAAALLLAGGAPPGAAQTLTAETLSGLPLRTIGPTTMSGRIVDLAVVEADPRTFYVATATGGVWKTGNHGVTLAPVFEREATHSVGAIAVHQVDTALVWVGTGERANRQSNSWGDGVYRSTDGGRSWTNVGLRDSHHIGRIALHPTDPNIVFVAALGHLWGPNEERGLYRSTDGGATWTRVLAVDAHTGAVDVALDPGDPSVVYAATYQRRRRPFGFHGGGPGSALWKSGDGGQTWRRLTAGLPAGDVGRIGITIYRRDPRILYVSVEQGYRYNASTAYTERRAGIYRSDDRGETWRHMGDWNPRPMYASQPLVDPTDDARLYMMNAFSVSEDSGRTFRRVRQSLHGDDRILWINPRDPRHLIKGDDGGLGVSYDRGRTWRYATHLPVAQFYRVSVDTRNPYWVYGGLQDNGSWMGPSATYRTEGVRFEDWMRTGGGDGFVNLVDTTDHRTLYTESQYLGLARLDLVTGARRWIRPGDPHGHIAARRNWDAWGPGVPEPELGNAMAPANWDGPFILSPHDPRTIYAGTNQLWKSADRGDTWTSLGDLTTGVHRRELLIMDQRAHDSTPSLDDGIPYYPTLTAVAESPRRRGVLYVGTDDGNLQVSQDDGATWTNVAARLPGLPPSAWIAGIEASRHADGRVYVAVNNYRNDDFANYLYRSDDFGRTWTAIVGDLPERRVARTVREDLRNPDVLYLGTELGAFYTNDGGRHWVELRSNLPTVAVNDLVLHPRDNDLVLGTHGRGIWILDNVNALQELTPAVLTADAHLFTLEPAETIRYRRQGGHTGDMVFHGANPPAGAIIDSYLRAAPDSGTPLTLTVHDSAGALIATLEPARRAGVQRVIWDLRHPPLDVGGAGDEERQLPGPWVLPGAYTVRLALGQRTLERRLRVRDDPRVTITDGERRRWHATMTLLAETLRDHAADTRALERLAARLDSLPAEARARHGGLATDVAALLPLARELRSRLARLYGQADDWPGTLTADQQAQLAYYRDWLRRLEPRIRAARAAAVES